MDDQIKEVVRARTDLVDLISGYTTLKGTGAKWKGLCPFHQEKTPSFQVDVDKGLWRCYGQCAVGGDCFSFLMKADGLTFFEALKQLAEKAGVTLPARSGSLPSEAEEGARQTAQKERDRLFSANALAVRFFQAAFERDAQARDYAKRRGLIPDTLQAFQVGYAPESWTELSDFLYQNNVAADDAVKAGLITPSRRDDGSLLDRFRGRLMFPIVDVQERVVGFGGRLLQNVPDSPKYLNSPETPVFSKSRVLYGLNKARRFVQENDLLVVVEGYTDVVACHQAGIGFVAATLGTSLTEEHVRMVRRYAKNVVLSFDADEAGVKAALRAAELFAASGDDLRLRVLSLPPGEDPDTLIAGGRASDFRKAVQAALTVPEFRLKTLENHADVESGGGRMALLREAVPIIAGVSSIVEQDALVQKMAVYHPVYATNALRAEESLRAEIAQSRGRLPSGGAFASEQTLTLPPPNQRGGPTGYRRDGNGNGGWNKRGGTGYKNYGRDTRPFVLPDTGPLPPPKSAWEEAERSLLRALLSDEWFPVLRRLLAAHDGQTVALLFNETLHAQLWSEIWPLVVGHISPHEAAHQIAVQDLAQFAVALRMETGEPLSEAALLDAFQSLLTRRKQQETMQIRARITQNGHTEGNDANADELLRRWSENARTLKGGGAAQNEA